LPRDPRARRALRRHKRRAQRRPTREPSSRARMRRTRIAMLPPTSRSSSSRSWRGSVAKNLRILAQPDPARRVGSCVRREIAGLDGFRNLRSLPVPGDGAAPTIARCQRRRPPSLRSRGTVSCKCSSRRTVPSGSRSRSLPPIATTGCSRTCSYSRSQRRSQRRTAASCSRTFRGS
jgi:hypothetical protein